MFPQIEMKVTIKIHPKIGIGTFFCGSQKSKVTCPRMGKSLL